MPSCALGSKDWKKREQRHRERVRQWTEPYRKRVARGETHPVRDFLWRYYTLRPGQLKRWHPGVGVRLEGGPARTFLKRSGYVERSGGVMVDARTLSSGRQESVRWIRRLLAATAQRPAQLGCFGLHEWAMIYRSAEVRHAQTPLRFPPDEIARIVEALPLCCTHFDAFRFFTPAARPLNVVQPTREASSDLEQRGCIHVTMDLYKWADKLIPFVPSELLADAFELALAAREIDMRACSTLFGRLNMRSLEADSGRRRFRSLESARTLRRGGQQSGPPYP